VGLACSSLPLGEDRGVVAQEAVVHNTFADGLEHALVSATGVEHVVLELLIVVEPDTILVSFGNLEV